MKKMLMAAVAVGMMATSTMAGQVTGSVTKVVLNAGQGFAKVCITDSNPTTYCKKVDVSTDIGKATYASALTAKSSGNSTVVGFHDGTNWTYLEVQ